jgi:simple sugar transport system permease protein
MSVERNAYAVIGLSGALSGLGGAFEIAGVTHQLGTSDFGYGYTAIAVALTGNLNPLGVLPAALVFAALDAGGLRMEGAAHVPAVAVSVIIGVVVLVLAIAPRLRTARA